MEKIPSEKSKKSCPFCSSFKTVKNGKKQFFCKNCKNYFTEGTTRKKFSQKMQTIIKTVWMLSELTKDESDLKRKKNKRSSGNNTKTSIRIYQKDIRDFMYKVKDSNVDEKTLSFYKADKDENIDKRNFSLKNAVLLLRDENSENYEIVSGLDLMNHIRFKDLSLQVNQQAITAKRGYVN